MKFTITITGAINNSDGAEAGEQLAELIGVFRAEAAIRLGPAIKIDFPATIALPESDGGITTEAKVAAARRQGK